MRPGMSRIWIEAPPQRSIPGMIETVVKSYAAASLLAAVRRFSNVDFPVDG